MCNYNFLNAGGGLTFHREILCIQNFYTSFWTQWRTIKTLESVYGECMGVKSHFIVHWAMVVRWVGVVKRGEGVGQLERGNLRVYMVRHIVLLFYLFAMLRRQ